MKYSELISELTSKQNNSLNALVSPKNSGKQSSTIRGHKSSIDFQRLLTLNLERENKALHEDIDYLRLRLGELESKHSRDSIEMSVTKELINQLSLSSEKELYKRVLYLKEFYNQSKEQRKFIQKLTTFVSQKTSKTQVSFKDMWNFISSKYN